MSYGYLFNPIISGVSVSGDLDTLTNPFTIEMGNSDRIGKVTFDLQNSQGLYSTMLISGNATLQINVVKNQIPQVLWKGTIEKITPYVDTRRGSVVEVEAYDYGQELLGVVSPDARVPYLLGANGANLSSGDAGAAIVNGMDLVTYTSGLSLSGTVTLAQFMSQWFGTQADPSGSASGSMLGFKPYRSSYTWKTYYYPDALSGVAASDNNLNYFLYANTLKARHEYGWDVLRKLTRQQHVVDINGNKVAMELYTTPSGAIHIFASGSYEMVASGANGIATLIYYPLNMSGSANNNIITAKAPFDLTMVKNVVEGFFPDWINYPTDDDFWTDWTAYSGGNWSGKALGGTVHQSGDAPVGQTGSISILNYVVKSPALAGAPGSARMAGVLTLGSGLLINFISGQAINLTNFNVSGNTNGVALTYAMKLQSSIGFGGSITTYKELIIYDSGGNTIWKSGGSANQLQPSVANNVWNRFTDYVFISGGNFYSGTGGDGGWKTSGTFDFGNITQIEIGFDQTAVAVSGLNMLVWLDNMYFQFDYPFSPVTAANSGSQGLYGPRYSVLEFPYQVSTNAASGIITSELLGRMGSQGIGEFVVKDNVNPVQLAIKPGNVFQIDAPVLGTGSGQVFNLWRSTTVKHLWSKEKGFETTINAYPFFSGNFSTSSGPTSNYVNYQTPAIYTQPSPASISERENYMPIGRPWVQPGR